MSNVKDLKIKLSACYAANRISRKLQSVDFDNITIIETILKETCELVKNTTQDTKVLGLETLLDVSSLNIEAGKKVPSYGSSIFLELYTKYFGDN